MKEQAAREVEQHSNRDRWRRRLNEGEREVNDFSTCKGHGKVAKEDGK